MLSRFSQVQLFATPWTVSHARFLCPWDPPGKNTGVDCHFLLQGIFPTQGSNLHYRQNSCGPGITDRLFTAEPVGKPCLMIYHRLTAENLISPSMPSQDLEETAHYPFPPQESREPLPINKRRGPGGRVRWRG